MKVSEALKTFFSFFTAIIIAFGTVAFIWVFFQSVEFNDQTEDKIYNILMQTGFLVIVLQLARNYELIILFLSTLYVNDSLNVNDGCQQNCMKQKNVPVLKNRCENVVLKNQLRERHQRDDYYLEELLKEKNRAERSIRALRRLVWHLDGPSLEERPLPKFQDEDEIQREFEEHWNESRLNQLRLLEEHLQKLHHIEDILQKPRPEGVQEHRLPEQSFSEHWNESRLNQLSLLEEHLQKLHLIEDSLQKPGEHVAISRKDESLPSKQQDGETSCSADVRNV